MIIGIPKEILENERRVAALPETVKEYIKKGFDVLVESAAGDGALKTDAEYEKAGAKIVPNAASLYAGADIILKVKQPYFNKVTGKHEVDMMKGGTILVTFIHPAAPSNHEMVRKLRDRKITAFTMDGIPRISRAQRMDALSSMSTVTGYKSVIIAANNLPRIIPMIGTAIGTLQPAKFLVIGLGVVGLQAIATAKRLGGSVKAVDIREEARKNAESLGAKVAGFDVPADLAVGEGGYAKTLPPEFLEKEQKELAPLFQEADVVILSALVPGEVAPVLLTEETIRNMKRGSVVVDVAIDQGGNCAMTEPGKETTKHGIFICGVMNIPGSMPLDASYLYSNNMFHYVANLFKPGANAINLDDDIVRHSLVTRDGKIVHEGVLKAMKEA